MKSLIILLFLIDSIIAVTQIDVYVTIETDQLTIKCSEDQQAQNLTNTTTQWSLKDTGRPLQAGATANLHNPHNY